MGIDSSTEGHKAYPLNQAVRAPTGKTVSDWNKKSTGSQAIIVAKKIAIAVCLFFFTAALVAAIVLSHGALTPAAFKVALATTSSLTGVSSIALITAVALHSIQSNTAGPSL